MVRYPDDLSLLEARNSFFRDAKLGPDGGYRDRWVRVETTPIPFYFPNWPAGVAAARLHDLHHIAAEYETDWSGRAEIAAWEIASGYARYHAAWILNFGGCGAGLVVAPRRVFRPFLRGRRAKTNLYKSRFDESRLNDITVGMLRDQLGLRAAFPSAGATRCWAIPSLVHPVGACLAAASVPYRHSFLTDHESEILDYVNLDRAGENGGEVTARAGEDEQVPNKMSVAQTLVHEK
jgi:hypothetical protein